MNHLPLKSEVFYIFGNKEDFKIKHGIIEDVNISITESYTRIIYGIKECNSTSKIELHEKYVFTNLTNLVKDIIPTDYYVTVMQFERI